MPMPMSSGTSPCSWARPMSRALYDSLPVGPELTVPHVPDAGKPAGFANAPGPVGTVKADIETSPGSLHRIVFCCFSEAATEPHLAAFEASGLEPSLPG